MISFTEQRGNTSTSKWYILRTVPNSDQQAASELSLSGYEVFSPRVKSPHAPDSWQYSPLFPGYLFLKWDIEGRGKPSLNSAPHISGWVNFEGECPSVPDDVVQELATRVDDINNTGGLWRKFKIGDKVRVISGKLETLGEVVEGGNSPNSKVRVLIEFMGRLTSAQVPWNHLYPVEAESINKVKPPRRTRGRGRWIRKPGHHYTTNN